MQEESIKIPRKVRRVVVFKLVGDQRYAHVRGHLENGLDIIGADRVVGRAKRKVVVQVMIKSLTL